MLSGRVAAGPGRIVHHFGGGAAEPGSEAGAGLARNAVAYVDFRLQRSFMNREAPYHQARWNSLSRQDSPLVSEYLSERLVKGIRPDQAAAPGLGPGRFDQEREQVAQLLGIEALLDRRLVQISSGERRRVLLARALLQKPRLLILDNPFAGLDQAFRPALRGIIEHLMAGEMAVMLVTTAWEDVPAGTTHVLLLDEGRVVAQGPRDCLDPEFRASGIATAPARSAGLVTGNGAAPAARPAPAADDVLVQMEGVRVAYGDVAILDGIEWTVWRGEHWALLGPNGAGKSTLLSLILGDNPQAYANRVSLFGRRRGTGESIWEVKERIGWVAPELQFVTPLAQPCLHVVCSGFFDSVGLYRRPSAQQQAEARRWLSRLGLSHRAGAAFGTVSEGEQRIVLLARAVVKRPSLLVLDEPCQGLDSAYRARVLAAVDEAGHSLDSSVIYVTHDPLALPSIVTHVLKLAGGRVVLQGPLNGHDLWA
jgi:molybdate transport system ATP-binding protein